MISLFRLRVFFLVSVIEKRIKPVDKLFREVSGKERSEFGRLGIELIVQALCVYVKLRLVIPFVFFCVKGRKSFFHRMRQK